MPRRKKWMPLSPRQIRKLKELDTKIKQAEVQLKDVEPDTTLVMIEMDKPRETHIMKRGNYLDTRRKSGGAHPG